MSIIIVFHIGIIDAHHLLIRRLIVSKCPKLLQIRPQRRCRHAHLLFHALFVLFGVHDAVCQQKLLHLLDIGGDCIQRDDDRHSKFTVDRFILILSNFFDNFYQKIAKNE